MAIYIGLGLRLGLGLGLTLTKPKARNLTTSQVPQHPPFLAQVQFPAYQLAAGIGPCFGKTNTNPAEVTWTGMKNVRSEQSMLFQFMRATANLRRVVNKSTREATECERRGEKLPPKRAAVSTNHRLAHMSSETPHSHKTPCPAGDERKSGGINRPLHSTRVVG